MVFRWTLYVTVNQSKESDKFEHEESHGWTGEGYPKCLEIKKKQPWYSLHIEIHQQFIVCSGWSRRTIE